VLLVALSLLGLCVLCIIASLVIKRCCCRGSKADEDSDLDELEVVVVGRRRPNAVGPQTPEELELERQQIEVMEQQDLQDALKASLGAPHEHNLEQ